jgi:hypothetical protein
MGLKYVNLDARTRELMVRELDRDLADGSLWYSDRLTLRGRADYPGLLRNSFTAGTDESLTRDVGFFSRYVSTY